MKQITLKTLLQSLKGKSIFIDNEGRVFIGQTRSAHAHIRQAITTAIIGAGLYLAIALHGII